jgi:hypothetical protein
MAHLTSPDETSLHVLKSPVGDVEIGPPESMGESVVRMLWRTERASHGRRSQAKWPGAPGTPGAPGPAGANGNTILNGIGPPASTLGNNGDFYIDTAAMAIYGPKASGAWPARGVSLFGGTNCQLFDPNAYLVSCNLSGANLSGVNLSGANLAGAVLGYANLSNTT